MKKTENTKEDYEDHLFYKHTTKDDRHKINT